MSRTRRHQHLSRQLSGISLAAPQVVALRTARMLGAGLTPSASDQVEFARMGSEKFAAAFESMHAMSAQSYALFQGWALGTMQQWWRLWLSPWALLPPRYPFGFGARPLLDGLFRIAGSGLAPINRRVTRNARRLRRGG
jgi:hypothetical protein